MKCNHGCQVSESVKAVVADVDIKCICKSVPFEVVRPGGNMTIYASPQKLPNVGLYTIVNNTAAIMTVDFVTSLGVSGAFIQPGSSITEQLINLERINVTGTTVAGSEDGRLDFEICLACQH